MPPQIRRKNSSVISQLEAMPGNFSFIQAMRLLERSAVLGNQAAGKSNVADKPIGRFTPPNREFVRISAHQSLAFPVGEIFRIELKNLGPNQLRWLVIINFLGLTGAMGVLPFHYSELIFDRLKLKDESLKQFFDIFNHRISSLFYQASIKYRLPIAYERHQLTKPRKSDYDSFTHTLLSLVGLGTPHLASNMRVNYLAMLNFAGILTQKVRSSSALKNLLASYFQIPIRIEEFVGQWHDLIDDVRCKMPDHLNPKGQNARLGKSAIIGSKGWFAQGKVRIVLGPLNREEFYRFAPGTAALTCLNDLVKFYAGLEQDFEYVICVSRIHLPNKIQLNSNKPPIIGWDTWLATQPITPGRSGETLNIAISSRRLG